MLISLQVARAFLQPGCFDDGNYRCLIRSTSELAGAGGMAAKVWSKSEGLGPVGEAEAGTEGAEGAVAGNEGEAGGEGVGGDKHVHGGEGVASLPGGGAEVGVGFRGGGVPGQNADAHEKLVDELGFGDGRNADLGHGNAAQMFANRRRIPSEGVAHAVGIEHETEHAMFRSEEAAFFGGAAIA